MMKLDKERILKIRRHCFNIQNTLKDVEFEEFMKNSSLDIQELSAFRLAQIGEHSNKLSSDLKNKYTKFDWAGAYKIRNIIDHNYEKISPRTIWELCKYSIPKLMDYTEKILEDIEKKA